MEKNITVIRWLDESHILGYDEEGRVSSYYVKGAVWPHVPLQGKCFLMESFPIKILGRQVICWRLKE